MTNTDIYFDFPLKNQQRDAFSLLIGFLRSTNNVFVLKGYAGTGKTTLMSGLIKYLSDKKLSYVLLASTGRAAKILGDKTRMPVSTIHSCIYKFQGLNEDLSNVAKQQELYEVDDKGQISLLFNMVPASGDEEYIYIIDEASMISDQPGHNGGSFAHFGSGNLLKDLFAYNPRGKFVFVGDSCQLPPVNQVNSPALDHAHLRKAYYKSVQFFELTGIVRQSLSNGIIQASLKVRNLFDTNLQSRWAYFPVRNHNNIHFLGNHADLIASYLNRIRENGFLGTTLICHTNRYCSAVNNIVRASLYGNQHQLCRGDLLMITQNNYLSPLVNGDLVVVEEIGSREYRCGLSFLQVEVKEIGTGKIFRLPMIEDLLYGISTNLNKLQHKNLLIDFYERMKKINIEQNSRDFNDQMLTDPYLNALRAVFGYALTCHKAQGGEWDEVFLYMDNKIQGIPRPGVYQWLYTAMTRAKENLYMVNDWFIK